MTAEELYHLKVQKAIIIQCFIRQALARMNVKALLKKRDERLKALSQVIYMNHDKY